MNQSFVGRVIESISTIVGACFIGSFAVLMWLSQCSWPLGLLFMVLKWCHIIDWPWVWVTAPFWMSLVFLGVSILGSVLLASIASLFAGSDDPTNGQHRWYTYVWMALPVGLLILGGLIGGVIGAIATYINGRIFRSGLPKFLKYGITGAISCGSLVVLLVVASCLTHLDSMRALVCTVVGDNQGAIEGLTRAIKKAKSEENKLDYFELRGKVRQRAGDYQGALEDIDAVIAVRPNYAAAYELRGEVRQQLKDYRGAIEDCSKLIQLEPKSALAYRLRSEIRKDSGDVKGAASDSETAQRIDSE